jgi:tetratricopeptide (TPR) repeat protein
MALGTPNYLAPEQIEGKPADARSDVFATGAVFYEILAYRKAFTGDTPAAVIKHVLSDLPEPLDRLAPNLDSRVVGIVNRCMEKRPEDRYPGAELVRRDVQVVLRDARSGNASPAPPRRSPEDDRMAQPEAQIEALIERARLALDRGAFAEARARNVLDSSQLDAALVAVEEALRLDPLNADARALREQIAALLESRRRAELLEHVLREARRRFEEGRYEAALASLHHAEQSDPRLDALRQELTERLRQVEEQSRRTRATEERQVEVLRPPATAAGPAGGVARTEIPTVIRSPAKSPWSPSTAIGILALPVMLVVSGVKTAVDALKRVARPRTEASGAQPPPPGQPLPVDDPVLLGVSAPRRGNPGATFPARFAAYVKTRESAVEDHLRRLDDALRGNVQTVVGLPPARGGRWMIGAPITVRVNGEHLKVKPSVQSFEWNGSENVVSFLVTVDTAAPHGTTQLCFEAFMEGVPVAFIPLNLVIGSQTADADLVTTTARPLSSAFASYASKDAPVVALLLSALKRWDPHAEVFMDCLDLTPNENWKHQLEQVIPSKDAFLLFWSTNASKSPWVAWELQHARSTKGLEWIRPMPIDDPETAPPPDFLQHLHFRDKYLIARQAFLRLEEQRTT